MILSLAMAMVLALPIMAFAQNGRNNGGLFGGQLEQRNNGGNRGMVDVQGGNDGFLTESLEETPTGCGLLILAAAGAGYAMTKRRKEKK